MPARDSKGNGARRSSAGRDSVDSGMPLDEDEAAAAAASHKLDGEMDRLD